MSEIEDILVANITQGTLFKTAPITFRTDDNTEIENPENIEARCEFRTRPGGSMIASMATAGGGDADGTIEVSVISSTSVGLTLRLPSAVTATLTPVYDPTTGAVEYAGLGDLKIWSEDFEDGEPMHGARFHVRVLPEVTE